MVIGDLAGFVLGLYLTMVWLEYDGSLVDDLARFLERKFKRNEK